MTNTYNRPCAVYGLYADETGELLYVGVSSNPEEIVKFDGPFSMKILSVHASRRGALREEARLHRNGANGSCVLPVKSSLA